MRHLYKAMNYILTITAVKNVFNLLWNQISLWKSHPEIHSFEPQWAWCCPDALFLWDAKCIAVRVEAEQSISRGAEEEKTPFCLCFWLYINLHRHVNCATSFGCDKHLARVWVTFGHFSSLSGRADDLTLLYQHHSSCWCVLDVFLSVFFSLPRPDVLDTQAQDCRCGCPVIFKKNLNWCFFFLLM